MNLIQKTRQFLKKENCDYLLVNSTNEFLVEYADLKENARYLLTNFSGSAGDALLSEKDLLLFVDSRYHIQADCEVDNKIVKVVKMKLNESFSKLIAEKIEPEKTLAIVATKYSQASLELLKNLLESKKIKIKLLSFDPIIDFVNKKEDICKKIEKIDTEITGLSADEKFEIIASKINKNEAILITNLEEISYLCNLRDFSTNYSSKVTNVKCIIKKDIAIVFTDYDIKEISKNFEIQKLSNFEKYIKNLKNINFLIDKTLINAYDYELIKENALFLKENHLREMKSIKNPQEIEHYKKCFERADAALINTRDFIEKNNNISEYDISKKLEEEFLKNGAKSLSFKSIVAKDKNSALAHYSKDSKTEIIEEGSLILIDCGAYFEGGYATDCTRVFIKGTPSTLQKKVYTTVLKGFLAAFNKKITKKTTGFILDKSAREVLEKFAPEGFEFSHSLGHGIGINVHESPPKLAFSPIAKTPLEKNMCFTIEPGLYKQDVFGVRLENSCYLTEEKGELTIKSLSNMCFEEKLIDFDMLKQTEIDQLKKFELR